MLHASARFNHFFKNVFSRIYRYFRISYNLKCFTSSSCTYTTERQCQCSWSKQLKLWRNVVQWVLVHKLYLTILCLHLKKNLKPIAAACMLQTFIKLNWNCSKVLPTTDILVYCLHFPGKWSESKVLA